MRVGPTKIVLATLIVLVKCVHVVNADDALGFVDAGTRDTLAHVALVEARCLTRSTICKPACFRLEQGLKGAPADSFAASDDWESRGWDSFRVGRRYLLSLTVPAQQRRFEVVEQFCARATPQYGVSTSIDLDPSAGRTDRERDSLRGEVTRIWSMGMPQRGARSEGNSLRATPEAPIPWTLAHRDSLLASLRDWLERERELSRPSRLLGKNEYDVRPDRVVAEDAMARIGNVYGPLAAHPDSATREFVYGLMTPPWTGLRRALATELCEHDTSLLMREHLAQVVPTGDSGLDLYAARRLSKGSLASAHGALVRLAQSSKVGTWLEDETFRALRYDTSATVRSWRWQRVRAGETDPFWNSRYNRIDNAPSIWDNGYIAFGWTVSEVRAAVSDSSERLRIVGARVARGRRDSVIARVLVDRLRTGRTPQGDSLSSVERTELVAALPTASCAVAIKYCSRLAKATDALGVLAFEGLSNLNDPRTIPIRDYWLDRACRGDRAQQARSAGWRFTRAPGVHDTDKLRMLFMNGDDDVSEQALGTALQECPPSRVAGWLRERFHGEPDQDKWARYLQLEDDVVQGRRR